MTDRRSLDAFIAVPWSLYADDPAWVPPLKLERRQALDPKHPYFQHARWQGWVAYRDGRPVGRISAQIDDLHLERYGDATGFFGMFEAPDDPDVAASLFAAAEDWLRGRGIRRAIGPLSLSINQEVGLLVDGFDTPPFVMMGHARPYYGALIESRGYTPLRDMLAYLIDRGHSIERSYAAHLKRIPPDAVLRSIDKRRLASELEGLRDIFNDAWSNNWGFVEFTAAEFQAIGREMVGILPADYIRIAEIDGEAVAFGVLLPNVNEAIADLDGRLLPFGLVKLLWRLKVKGTKSGRLALMGVRQRLQRTRIGPALAIALIRDLYAAGYQRGFDRAELSWVLEDNRPMRHLIENIGCRVSKRYRVYEKHLNG